MKPPVPDPIHETVLGQTLSAVFDAEFYTSRHPDVAMAGLDPLWHFVVHGAAERRDPNPWFDSAWYAGHYADVGAAGVNPLLHYLEAGAAELRNPHPRFDAAWYIDEHPEAAGNPLLFHLRVGISRGWLTEKPVVIADYLPSTGAIMVLSQEPEADVVIPVYRGLEITRRCIQSVLSDTDRLPGRVIVIDDKSPEPALSAWLKALAAEGRITLLRNRHNLGFVASVNRGMREAGRNDVVLLNSDTEVPSGWLRRLAACAYADARTATVSPFSNNATICGYPNDHGSPMPFGRTLAEVDAICRQVNAGRTVDLPTTVGFCMYIKRGALEDVGLFDETAFGRGYGEENDFCLRATAWGWRHALACDVFVYHEGSVSFGDQAGALTSEAVAVLTSRYPNYLRTIAQHVRLDAVGPYRIAVTAALFAQSGLPVILMVSHDLGGGVAHHIDRLVRRLDQRAHCLMLQATARGARLSVLAVSGHPVLDVPAERLDDLLRVLRSAGVSRVHIHHLAGLDIDIERLIHRLGVPFDVTVHDYFAICPQVNLLPWLDGLSCGEPGPAACNACIAARASHGARDIVSWRRAHAWLFLAADRVICPSVDAQARLARFGLGGQAVVAPHDPVPPGPWPVAAWRRPSGRLRVALIGILANHKGAAVAEAVMQTAARSAYEFHLIGDVEHDFPDAARARLRITGRYDEADLADILTTIRPHILWFPASWPETFSYTLSTAIESGLPIVASSIGSFPERLANRPMTWLVPPTLDVSPWLAAFEAVRGATPPAAPVARKAVPDFYETTYLVPPARSELTDLRRPGRTSVLVIPERSDNGVLSPCAYIRLLLPLDHPAIGKGMDIVLADPESALQYRSDIIATQRHAVPNVAAADALAAHARATGAMLLYDLDDDLLNIPHGHPDAKRLRPKAKTVQRMLQHADRVFVSTQALAASIGVASELLPNGLDERLWGDTPPTDRRLRGQLRILCMGTATHDADFAMIEPALERIKTVFGHRVSVDMLGFSSRADLPEWVNRVSMSPNGNASYPGFVNWITAQNAWDVGLAPLADTAFNRCKSAIKTLDYAAIGLPVLASDVAVYRGSLADGPGGMLVRNTTESWYAAISRLVRDPPLRDRLARGAQAALAAHGTLAVQAEMRRAAWMAVLGRSRTVLT